MRPDSLAVIGLGPVGGSIAWGAVQAGVPRVVGVSRIRGDLVRALKAGAIHESADRAASAVKGADLVVIADPSPADLLGQLSSALSPQACITSIVDLALPAGEVAMRAGLAPRWAASHPLRTVSAEGSAPAHPDRYRGSVVYVAAADLSGDGAASEVMHFWSEVLGADPHRLGAADHDRRIGWMEHLPRLLANAVAAAYDTAGLGAATWGSDARAMTDLAAHDPALLAELLVANRAVVREAIAATTGALDALAAAIASGDRTRITSLLEAARQVRRGNDR